MKIKKVGLVILAGIALVAAGFIVGRIIPGKPRSGAVTRIGRSLSGKVADGVGLSDRALVLAENPGIVPALAEGAKFGAENLSTLTAQNIFSPDPEVTEEIRKKTHVRPVAEGVWHIRLPIVNCTLFETDDGLVLVDTGMTAAGPVLRDIIKDLSDRPLAVVIYTHYHVDHAYGTWSLREEWDDLRVIAHETTAYHFDRYRRFPGNIARLMSQPEDQIVQATGKLVYPTETFRDEMTLSLGGVDFRIVHAPAETGDQCYVWVPDAEVLCVADYYQGFLPNAGNGKRIQRFVEEWAEAFRDMADLEPAVMVPGHGPAMDDPDRIVRELTLHAAALDSIVEQVEAGLNAGLRPDEVVDQVRLPPEMASEPSLRTVYVTPEDIARMVARRYTGWWDGVPSHYDPPTYRNMGFEWISLIGGITPFIDAVYDLAERDIAAACVLADYAWFAFPEDPQVQQMVMDTYGKRISEDAEATQEILAYLDHLTEVRAAMRRSSR